MAMIRICDECNKPCTADGGVWGGKGKLKFIDEGQVYNVNLEIAPKLPPGYYIPFPVEDLCADCLRKKLRLE